MNSTNFNLVPWAIFLGTLLIYSSVPTKNYYWDGVDFAQTIEDARALSPVLLHPNHLLYNVAGYIVYKAARGLGMNARALEVLQFTNSILGALSAYLLFHILRLSLRSIYLCSVLTLLFSFSATWWKFSTDADAYIPAVLLLLVSFYLIHPAQRPRPLLVALTFSASMFFHQLAVIFYPVIVLGILLQTPALTVKRRALLIFEFSAVAFILTLSTFTYCFYLSTGTFDFGRFVRWLTAHSPDSSFTFSVWRNLLLTLRGHARLLFGGRFNFIKGLVNPLTVLLMCVLVTASALLTLQILRNLKSSKFDWWKTLKHDGRFRPLLLLCALWISVYLVFLFFWMPHNTFYRLFYLPALIILCGLVLESYENPNAPRRKYRALLFVIIVAASNFVFLIFPYSRVEKNPPLALALEIRKAWGPGTVIYYAMPNADNGLFKYFNPSTTWKQLDATEAAIAEADLQKIYASGGAAWLDLSAIDYFSSQPGGQLWLAQHAGEQPRYELTTDPAFKIKFIQIVPRTLVSDGGRSRQLKNSL